MALIDRLIEDGYLKTPLIIEAFRNINRADFVPEDMRNEAEVNAPLPIGYGQTISQPLTVAFMLELLQPEPGDKVLDIGFGSGWTTALLAYAISQQSGSKKSEVRSNKTGKVFAIERIPELAEFGKNNVAKYNFIEKGIVEMICGDGTKGWKEKAPFDCIQAAAAVPLNFIENGARKIPQTWKDQLKIEGRIVTPVGGSIWLLVRKSEKEFEEHEYPGFAFVPLIEDKK